MALVLHCEICIKRLDNQCPIVKEAYETICEYYAKWNAPMQIHGDSPDLSNVIGILERLEFVVSTECDETLILVVPRGVNITDDGLVICPAYTHLGERFGQK
jgi:hypothetical protein